jgi:RNA polymerase sigma factor (sigma-70 family)
METSRIENDVEFLRSLKRSYGLESAVDKVLKFEIKTDKPAKVEDDEDVYIFTSSKKSQFSERAVEYRQSLAKVSSGYYKFLEELRILSPEEHVEYARVIEAGVYAAEMLDSSSPRIVPNEDLIAIVELGKSAQEIFVLHNLKLVRSTAMKLRNLYPNLDIEELFQSGVMGLIRAMQKWDWRRGYTFSTYATWWIRQSIYRDIQDNYSLIRLPVHLWENIKYDKENQEWLDSKKEQISSSKNSGIWKSLSLESIDSLEKAKYFEDLEHLDSDLDLRKFEELYVSRSILRELLMFLDDIEVDILVKRFGLLGGETETLEKIGNDVGVTRERIRQIEAKTIIKIQNLVIRDNYEFFECRNYLLREYLEVHVDLFEAYWYVNLTNGRIRKDPQLRVVRVDSKRKLDDDTNRLVKEMTTKILARIFSLSMDGSLIPKSTLTTN